MKPGAPLPGALPPVSPEPAGPRVMLDALLDLLADRVAARVLAQLDGWLAQPPDRGAGDTAGAGDERLLTAAEVARQFNRSTKWVYRHAARWPFTRRLSANTLRFSRIGLEQWLARRR